MEIALRRSWEGRACFSIPSWMVGDWPAEVAAGSCVATTESDPTGSSTEWTPAPDEIARGQSENQAVVRHPAVSKPSSGEGGVFLDPFAKN